MGFAPLSEKEERIGKIVLEAAFAVHSALGPGLLENVYEVCSCRELKKRGLAYQRQGPFLSSTMESSSMKGYDWMCSLRISSSAN